MDDVISLQPLDGILAHDYSPPWHFIGTDDRYSAKTRTGTKQILQDRQISANKGQFDLVFPRGKREKASILCCLVHLCGVLWLWQEGGEEAERAFTVWCVCDEATASLPADLPPCASAPEWAESTDSHAHTEMLFTFRQTLWDTSDVGYRIYRRHWLDRMHLITRVFLRPGWVHRLRWDPAHEFRAANGPQMIQCCETVITPQVSHSSLASKWFKNGKTEFLLNSDFCLPPNRKHVEERALFFSEWNIFILEIQKNSTFFFQSECKSNKVSTKVSIRVTDTLISLSSN